MDLYARPSRLLLRQLAMDAGLILWIFIWFKISTWVDWLVSLLAVPPRAMGELMASMESGMESAANSVGGAPAIGDTIRVPFDYLAGGFGSLGEYAFSAAHGIEIVATVVAVVVFVVPVAFMMSKWLPERLDFWRNSGKAKKLVRGGSGLRLFALRAMATAPLLELAKISPDPMGAWLDGDEAVVRRLAMLELNKDGYSLPADMKPKRSSWRRKRLTSGTVVDD
jgi:hypothetical protein